MIQFSQVKIAAVHVSTQINNEDTFKRSLFNHHLFIELFFSVPFFIEFNYQFNLNVNKLKYSCL